MAFFAFADGRPALGNCLATLAARLTVLSTAKLWVGLRNSDDVGLRLDLKAEVFVNSTSVSPIWTASSTT